MAKKRKAGGRVQDTEGPNLDVGKSRRRIQTYEDVADSDDEFHDARDHVLLEEEPDAKRRRTWNEQEQFLEPSDEEVLGYSESEDEDAGSFGNKPHVGQTDSEGEESAEDDTEELGWGTSKVDLYGADAIETEEQALEEEAEALKLQKKQLQSMHAADYGFDEADWQGDKVTSRGKEDDTGEVVTEVIPQLQISDDASPAERLKLLKSRYPEFEPLSRELIRMKSEHERLIILAKGLQSNVIIKYRTATAYLGALIGYFSLLTSPAWNTTSATMAISPSKLQDHPVMATLIECRNLWQKVEMLSEERVLETNGDNEATRRTETHGVERSVAANPNSELPAKVRPTRAQRHISALQATADARRAERLKRTEADLAGLEDLIAPINDKKDVGPGTRPQMVQDEDSDIGEEARLTAMEAAEKAKRKKSLRFYTSQIAQKANKRGAVGRSAGGDEDIPHRERLRDRQMRLNAEAEKRGRRQQTDAEANAQLGGESEDDDDRQAQQIRADAEDVEYYDLIAARSAMKKSDKAALAEAQKRAATEGGRVVEEERVGADGKRKITYAIEKNKGLTPFRKKDVRNPRVKKRRKYDEKKKKLASIKPVYKGGEGRGGYGGELTGIKKGLVKSTKL